MNNWTNKQWGALIGFVVILVIALVGIGEAALTVLGGAVGYLVGKYLDRDFDLEDIRDRARGRREPR
jgi:membrane protein YqaA with SNARE-associated domain